jgi:hypothetical protein
LSSPDKHQPDQSIPGPGIELESTGLLAEETQSPSWAAIRDEKLRDIERPSVCEKLFFRNLDSTSNDVPSLILPMMDHPNVLILFANRSISPVLFTSVITMMIS